MTVTRIESGRRMSQAVVHNGVVYLAGQVASGATVADQMSKVLAQIDSLLAQARTSKAHLLSVTIWLADIAEFDQMNMVWDAWVGEADAPCRATGQVLLAAPEFRVEVIAIAAVPN